MQIYTALLSEDVDQGKFLNDWSKEPGNEGFGNPAVEFRWISGSQVTAHIHSNPGKPWAEDNSNSSLRLSSIGRHQTAGSRLGSRHSGLYNSAKHSGALPDRCTRLLRTGARNK